MMRNILSMSSIFRALKVQKAYCSTYNPPTTTSPVGVSYINGVKSIVLSDDKTRNSLSLNMLKTLQHEILHEVDPDLRCVVLSAVGNVFSAGHYLRELISEEGRDYHSEIFNECSILMLGIQQLPVPVIAQVNGAAAAAGCQLVASCDIVIASDTSTFITPGGNVGIFCSTPAIPLMRNVPRKVAADMLLTGLPISAQKALEVGLVSAVVPEEELNEETDKRIEAILRKSKSVISLGKEFMYKQLEMSIEDAYREGCEVMVNNINMVDGQEGIKSFVAKKKPNWTHGFD